ncbi:MAG: hypothetical protein AAFV26_03150 [Pseudomonadota bacterium]
MSGLKPYIASSLATATATAALLVVAATHFAHAADDTAKAAPKTEQATLPTETIKELTSPENTKEAPSGAVVMKDRAKPVENWFGCKPEQTATAEQKEACEAKAPDKVFDQSEIEGAKPKREATN